MLTRMEWCYVVLFLLAIGGGIFFGKTPEVLVGVTAIYVFVVYLQLRVGRRQLDELVQDRTARLQAEKERQPRLEILPPMVRKTPEAAKVGEKPKGIAYYVVCRVVNHGGSVSRNSQPLVTAAARKTGDGRWNLFDNWLPLEPVWLLDEIATKGGSPTRERNLVPERQYQFNLCKLSLLYPDPKLEVMCLIRPFGQDTLLDFGEYSFEVRVYSENAAPCAAWCMVTYSDHKGAGYPVTVSQAYSPPWDT